MLSVVRNLGIRYWSYQQCLALFLRPVVSICFFVFRMRLLSIFYARAESNFFYMSFIDSWSSEKLKQFATLSLFTAVAMKNHPPHSKCNPPDKLFQSLSDRYQRKQWLQPLFDTFLLFQIINNRRLRWKVLNLTGRATARRHLLRTKRGIKKSRNAKPFRQHLLNLSRNESQVKIIATRYLGCSRENLP